MLRKIDKKYIENALQNNGRIFIENGVFEPHYENQVVKKKIPVISFLFPFIKRKSVERVVTGKDLVIKKEEVSRLRQQGNSAPKHLQERLAEIPYDKICKLDPVIYGENLVLAQVHRNKDEVQKYDILTKDGVILGRFEIKEGYYNPDFNNALLPNEAVRSHSRHQSAPELSFEQVVASYCAKNPETVEHIPNDVYTNFPKLPETIAKETEAQKNSSRIETSDFSLK